MSKQTATIHFEVTTDENRIPSEIRWSASDAGIEGAVTGAIALRVWDGQQALAIDLWDRQMSTDQMKTFVVQSMMTLADTLERATQDQPAAGAIRRFTQELAERIGVSPSQD